MTRPSLFRPSLTRAVTALLVLTLTLAACASVRDSRVNPRNWFGRAGSEPSLGPVAEADRRPLVPSVSELTIERTSTGAIVRAEAVMPEAGWWDPALIAENNGRPVDGVLTYRFVAARPRQPVAAPTPGPLRLVAAATLTNFDLELVREVVVTGAGNAMRARR